MRQRARKRSPTCSTDAAFRDLSGEVSEQAAERNSRVFKKSMKSKQKNMAGCPVSMASFVIMIELNIRSIG